MLKNLKRFWHDESGFGGAGHLIIVGALCIGAIIVAQTSGKKIAGMFNTLAQTLHSVS